MAYFTRINELDQVLTRLKSARDRDEHDDCMSELSAIAPKYIDAIDALYDSDKFYRMSLIWSLIGQTDKKALSLFSRAIKDRDQYTRWAAATALSRCRTRAASNLLVEALKDRSHLVKGVAIDAMALARHRNSDAVPQLRKILESRHLQEVAPGFITAARKALGACEVA